MSSKLRKTIQKIIGRPTPESVFGKYEAIGARSLMEGYVLNGFSINKKNDESAERVCYNGQGDVDSEITIQEEDSGGVIVFPANFERVFYSSTDWNGLSRSIGEESVHCVAVGSFVKGNYKVGDGSRYDKTSLSIEVLGISEKVLHEVATVLAQEAKVNSVLVKNYRDHRIYVVK